VVGLIADATSASWACSETAVRARLHSHPNRYGDSTVVAGMLFAFYVLVEPDTLSTGPSVTAIHFLTPLS